MDAPIGVLCQNSLLRVNNSIMSNKLIAINGTFSSIIVSQNNAGTNNDYSLWSEYDSKISKIGIQPSSNFGEVEENGGIIT